ncbi:polysaccharide deacetylase family protein [Paenibacillaceae bacterium WGS1546]|uniref:polysaccharide deacetylase family protein n=1 Tax=Cohnella sp. WGS1546 TaxID=3366810 RepID=UPI00372D72A4
MNKPLTPIIVLFFVGFILGSCAADRPAPQASPFQARTYSDSPANPDGKLGMLAGGPESIRRAVRSKDNYALQRRFPNIVVLRGSSASRRLALTFDDGPDSRFTPQLLDILKKHGVKATFFVMGARVDGHPAIARRMHEEGHVLGNHTYWHPRLWVESFDRIRWEANETDKAIEKITGYSPKLFRPPYGGLDDELVTELGKMNYSVVGWSVDSYDWKQLDSAAVQGNVLDQLHPGAIILMHSAGDWTQDLTGMVQAVDALIPRLKEEGYEFVTVPELLGLPIRKPSASDYADETAR